MIELLPEIKLGNTYYLNNALSLIYLSLLIWGCISLYRVLRLIEERVLKEKRLKTKTSYNIPDDLMIRFWVQDNFVLRPLLVKVSKKDKEFVSLKWPVIYFLLIMIIVVWLLVLLMKLKLLPF